MAALIDGTPGGSNITGAVATATNNLTVGSNPNRALIAMMFSGQPTTPLSVVSVTGGGGAAWVKVGSVVTGTTREFEIWSSVGPSIGAQTVQPTWSANIGSEDAGVIVFSVYNVDQTTPADTYTTNTGTTLTITVPSAAGNLVLANGIFNAATSGFSGVQDYSLSNFEEWRAGHDNGSASVILTWSGTAGTGRGINACNINQFTGGGGTPSMGRQLYVMP